MLFFILSNIDIQFIEKKFTWRFYIIAKILLTTKQVEIINKKKFDKTALDKNFEISLIHIIALKTPKITIYASKAAQVIVDNLVQVAALQ